MIIVLYFFIYMLLDNYKQFNSKYIHYTVYILSDILPQKYGSVTEL